MTTSAEPSALALPGGLERLLLALFAGLAATISLKISGVQLLEILEIALLFYMFVRMGQNRWQLQLSRPLFWLAIGYTFFLALACAGGVLALTRPVYLEAWGLYGPGWITFARAAELLAGASTLVILAQVFRDNRALCLFAMRVFFWVGVASSIVSIIALLAYDLFGISSRFLSNGRASGFLNEGGPYGLYLVAVLSLGLVVRSLSSPRERRLILAAQLCNILALFASASKAGDVAAALLVGLQLFLSSGLRQRIATGVLVAVVLGIIVTTTEAWVGTVGYIAGGQTYEVFSQLRPQDGNFVIGRVAGFYFVPRMIKAHPWAGVGWGNYGLVRNNVQYRGLSPVVNVATDQPGLGLYGTTAEIGIPLMALLLLLFLWPVRLVRRLTRWRALITLALVQPVVHLCGGQLNLTYPWIVTAFALGMAGVSVPIGTASARQTSSKRRSGPRELSLAAPNPINI